MRRTEFGQVCRVVAIAVLVFALAAIAPFSAGAQDRGNAAPQSDDGVHLGVASCAGSTCHGAAQPIAGSPIKQDEFLVWSQESDPHRIDLHHRAYTVLLGDRAIRIARNLGLPDAVTANICLDCHADNIPPARRGPEFQISDGVGCEACHGGAVSWLGTHLAGLGHKADLAAGLYPTDQPIARAQRCLSCHLGDEKHVMTHRIMGAGHPRMPFELDDFTAIEPAHFVVDSSYIARKGLVNGAQVWAVGQAVSLAKRMDRILDPKNAPHGVNPELMLFDCATCHHGVDQIRWTARSAGGLGPGSLRLYDADAVMLRVIAARVAPAVATSLSAHLVALHRATKEDWGAVQREATQLRTMANDLIPVLAARDFTRDDMTALAAGLIDAALTGKNVGYSSAEQTTLALDAILAAMGSFGYVTDDPKAIDDALNDVYRVLEDSETYQPDAFVRALGGLQKVVPK